MQRNQLREQRIFNQLEQVRQQPNLMVIDCQYEGLLRQDFWVLWIKGKIGTIWQNMIIPVQITFPTKYPIQPPSINFPSQFKHIHVYQGGQICMPILEQQYWKPKSTMVELIKRINSLIHQQINPYSPANHTLYEIYKTNIQEYNRILGQQKKKYLVKNPKYYQMACVHIQFMEEDQ